ncbi:hypothetical protein ACVWZR_008628 [Bradyrhizobium sp. i1.3.1]
MVPPCTSNAEFFSMPAIWSGGMSQANWYSPESSPLMRLATSGTSRKRMRLSGGRPPQYSSCASRVSDTSGLSSTTLYGPVVIGLRAQSR